MDRADGADLRRGRLAVQEKPGLVPNAFLPLARRPAGLRAFLACHDLPMDRPGARTEAEREMTMVAASAADRCFP